MYDPWVTREFRIEDLPAHRSGLPDQSGTAQALLGYSRADMIHKLRYVEPVTSFRTKFAYQNVMLLVEAAIIEKITGKTWEHFLQQRIFKPLGMTASSAILEGYLNVKNVAALHVLDNNKIKALDKNWPHMSWPYVFGPSGGINSNINDMAKWLMLHINHGKFNKRQIISALGINNMQRLRICIESFIGLKTVETDIYAALSWVYKTYSPHPIIWHSGVTTGHHTLAAFIPQDKLGILIFTNINNFSPYALAWKFFDMYYAKPDKDWSKIVLQEIQELKQQAKQLTAPPKHPKPPLPLTTYTGTYYNEIYGNVKLTKQGQQLILTIGPKRVKMLLKPWHRDVFTLIWPDEHKLSGLLKCEFVFGKDDNPNKMIVEMLPKVEFVRIK